MANPILYTNSDVSEGKINNNTVNVQSMSVNIGLGTLTIISGSSGLTSTQANQLKKMISGDDSYFAFNKTYLSPGWGGEIVSFNLAQSTASINTNPNQTFVWNVTILSGGAQPSPINSITFRYLDIENISLSDIPNALFTTSNQIKKSNLYAERVFAQHPAALWPLDDDISYIQLFNEDQRQLGNIYQWLTSGLNILSNVNYDAKSNTGYPGFGVKQISRTNYAEGNGLATNSLPNARGTATRSGGGIEKFPTFPSMQMQFENNASTSKNGVVWYGFLSNLWSNVFESNTEYIVSLYIRQKNTTYGTYRLRVSQYDISNNLISETIIGSKTLSSVDGEWYRLYGNFVSASNGYYADIDLEVSSGNGQQIYADGIMMEKTNVLLPYFEEISEDFKITFPAGGGLIDNVSPTTISYFDTGTPNIRLSPTASSSYIESIFSLNTASATYSTYFDEDKTGCFSTYVYIENPLITSFEIGIKYDSTTNSTTYNVANKTGWVQISHTFDIVKNKTIKFFIRPIFDSINYKFAEFQFAAVTFGQWSENYNSYSIGYDPSPLSAKLTQDNIPSSIINNSSEYSYREVDSYGLDTSLNGMYLIKNKKVYADTYGVPLVFGSTNTTKIYRADDDNPSIILPGQGFLNKSGKYNSYTFEAWIRLDNLSVIPTKIIGPTKSLDGIYVEEGFISLKIGDYSQSYFVGKWYRPILLNLVYSPSNISLFINGSRVISLNISTDNLSTFPEKEYDWIGIYGNDLIDPFEIDCISICPYIVPDIILKKRFVYGQGSGEIKISNNEIDAETALIDYSASKYATNVIYPDVSKWSEGFGVNTQTTSTYITTPDYILPEVRFSNNSTLKNTSEWLKSNYYYNIYGAESAYPYIVMDPSRTTSWSSLTNWSDANIWSSYLSLTWNSASSSYTSWSSVFYPPPPSILAWNSFEDLTWGDFLSFEHKSSSTYNAESTIYYKSINVLNEDIASIVGVFSSMSSSSSYQSLMYFKNNITNDYLDIYLNGASVIYKYNSTILKSEYVGYGNYFVAGINLDNFTTQYFSTVKNFFDNPSIISLNIGGVFNNSFAGKIYAIHFSNNFFYDKDLISYFDANEVFVKQSSVFYFINYTANYSLLPILYNSTMALDIGTSSYWEDYQPLSFFGKFINNVSSNSTYYDLDMMQFNADIPNNASITTYTYQDLKDMYISYYDLKYDGVQSSIYKTYGQLKSNISTTYSNIELDSGINMYLSFQSAQDVGKILYKNLTNQSLPSNKVIEFNNSTYTNKKYELKDGTVIIPPKYPNFQNFFVGLHIEYKVRGINTKKLYIRRMELASVAYDENQRYSIGTRYGNQIYPFTRDNQNFIFKTNNPFTIYKDSSPYFYLTENSGIYINDYPLSASLSASASRGAYLDINPDKNNDFELAGIQFWCRYPNTQLPINEFKIASIIGRLRTIDLWAKPESNRERIKIYAKENNQILDCIFYLDGNMVQNPYIGTKTWSSVAISLKDIFDFYNFSGRLELYSGLTYNVISTYRYLSQIVGQTQQTEASWYYITSSLNPSSLWSTIQSLYPSWGSFPVTTTVVGAYAINADKVYNSAVGLANTVHEDLTRITIISNGVDTFTDVEPQTIQVVPV